MRFSAPGNGKRTMAAGLAALGVAAAVVVTAAGCGHDYTAFCGTYQQIKALAGTNGDTDSKVVGDLEAKYRALKPEAPKKIRGDVQTMIDDLALMKKAQQQDNESLVESMDTDKLVTASKAVEAQVKDKCPGLIPASSSASGSAGPGASSAPAGGQPAASSSAK